MISVPVKVTHGIYFEVQPTQTNMTAAYKDVILCDSMLSIQYTYILKVLYNINDDIRLSGKDS